jgi:DNA mismatch repair protein MutS
MDQVTDDTAQAKLTGTPPGPGATPMMAQYLEIKATNPNCLLFYRMGDFYELFFEDAEIASRALGIALTKRGKHQGEDIPMCGVPVHAAGDYLHRLIKLEHKVAVCEQTEDPAEAKKRGSKAVVRREVVRLVTPGTLTEDNLLTAKRNNYLAALARIRSLDGLALAWLDISTGEFAVTATDAGRLGADLARLEPGEIITADSILADAALEPVLRQSGYTITPLPASRFDSASAERKLKQHFNVEALEAFGAFSRLEIAAAGALIDYVLLTQVGRLPAIRPPRLVAGDEAMLIDAATRANLELTRTLSGSRKGSLLDTIDRTITGAGGRLLNDRMSAPLTDPDTINQRLDAVDYFHRQPDLRTDLRRALKSAPDVARALSRISLERGSPRDLGVIRAGLAAARELAERLSATAGLDEPSAEIVAATSALASDDGGLAVRLHETLSDELPLHTRDGGYVRQGFSTDLDEHRRLRDDARKVIAGLQATYAEQTGVKSLKIRHNNVLGYFIEVTQQNASILTGAPHIETFVHRQTMANAMRFTTSKLADLQSRISMAGEQAIALEQEIFDQLIAAINEMAELITALADAIATLDVAAGLAELASEQRYTRPKIDTSRAFVIKDGRHPVVEAALHDCQSGQFIPNSCDLTADDGDTHNIWLLTGPNMAGKSTYLRQNAIIALLAQMGSFVPAAEAHIGIIDRLFSRVGAADDLARGRSTFMVEMVETATILNQASERSLVILDEIGRGTATFDGLSIAWASVEHLHEVNCCRALFATHFHELTALSSRLEHLTNATMKVREFQGDVVFLHEVAPGAADRSYGIQVAKLAGLPPAVLARASEVLDMLERTERSTPGAELGDDLPLFSAARPVSQAVSSKGSSPLDKAMAGVLPDELTPREALDLIYRLKEIAVSVKDD